MKIGRLTFALLILVAALGIFSQMPVANAATITKTSGNITVAPAAITTQVGSQQLQSVFTVGVKNNYDVAINLSAALSGLDVRNNKFYPTASAETALTTTTTITPDKFTLEPNGSATVQVTINDSTALRPGGHFAALLITQTGAPNSSNLSLQAAISASIYVIKEDGALRNIVAKNVSTNRNIFSLPSLADVAFFNNGNVNVVPRGTLTITKSGNSTPISRAVINPTSIPLFSRQTTKLQSSFNRVASPLKVGKYDLKLQYSYIGDTREHSLTTSFWYIPKIYGLGALIAVAFVVYFINYKHRKIALKLASKIVKKIAQKSR